VPILQQVISLVGCGPGWSITPHALGWPLAGAFCLWGIHDHIQNGNESEGEPITRNLLIAPGPTLMVWVSLESDGKTEKPTQ
jgi:hypothetical protein